MRTVGGVFFLLLLQSLRYAIVFNMPVLFFWGTKGTVSKCGSAAGLVPPLPPPEVWVSCGGGSAVCRFLFLLAAAAVLGPPLPPPAERVSGSGGSRERLFLSFARRRRGSGPPPCPPPAAEDEEENIVRNNIVS